MQQQSPKSSDQPPGLLDKLWRYLIQPEKVLFNKDRLGYDLFTVDSKHTFRRDDDAVENVHRERIEYTHYSYQRHIYPFQEFGYETCLVYLHSHGSNRAEGLHLLSACGDLGVSLCLFDFGGSGYSGGKYTSLGIKEAGECKVIIDELKLKYGHRRFILWGRSMGAVTAIIYASECPEDLDFLVLDSPFADLEELLKELVDKHFFLGEVFIGFFLYMFGDDIKKRIGFDISELKPVEFCPRITTNLAFVLACNDHMVGQKNIKEMYDACSSTRKHNILINGTHSSTRTPEDIGCILDCIRQAREAPDEPYPPQRLSFADSRLRFAADACEGDLDFRIPLAGDTRRMQDVPSFAAGLQHSQKPEKEALRESDLIPDELRNSELCRIASKLSIKRSSNSPTHQKENIPLQDPFASPTNPNKKAGSFVDPGTPADMRNSKLMQSKLRESILGGKLNDSQVHIWDSLVLQRDLLQSEAAIDFSAVGQRAPVHLTASQPVNREAKKQEKQENQTGLQTIHEELNTSSKSSVHRSKTSKTVSIFDDDKPVLFDKLKVVNHSSHKNTLN